MCLVFSMGFLSLSAEDILRRNTPSAQLGLYICEWDSAGVLVEALEQMMCLLFTTAWEKS